MKKQVKKQNNENSNIKEPLSTAQIHNFHRTIASNVARIRKTKGLSQLDLSLAIGYKSCSLVAGAEAGYKNVHFNLEQLYRIAFALEVDISEFFKTTKTPKDL